VILELWLEGSENWIVGFLEEEIEFSIKEKGVHNKYTPSFISFEANGRRIFT